MPFNRKEKHIQFNIENKISIKVDKSILFFINVMFMKLVKFNKLIVNIEKWYRAIHLVSPSHMIWGWTFCFTPLNHPFFGMGDFIFLYIYLLF